MKPLIDAHTHTVASGHAYSSLQEMAKAAASNVCVMSKIPFLFLYALKTPMQPSEPGFRNLPYEAFPALSSPSECITHLSATSVPAPSITSFLCFQNLNFSNGLKDLVT